jgi:hypothetical protein
MPKRRVTMLPFDARVWFHGSAEESTQGPLIIEEGGRLVVSK